MTTYTEEELTLHLMDEIDCSREIAQTVVNMAIQMEEDGIWEQFFNSELSPPLLVSVVKDLPNVWDLPRRWNWCAGLRGSYEYLNGYRISDTS